MSTQSTTPVRFHGLLLAGAPGRVFTPRPATEALVDAAIARVGTEPARIADVGTGSGAVAIALAAWLPQTELWATDTCSAAVELARENVHAHGLDGRVHVLDADLLDGVPRGLDLIVANLPYLTAEAAAAYPEEPPEAVVSGDGGLAHYRRLLATAGGHLAPTGGVVLQFRGDVLEAERSEVGWLSARLEALARAD